MYLMLSLILAVFSWFVHRRISGARGHRHISNVSDEKKGDWNVFARWFLLGHTDSICDIRFRPAISSAVRFSA